MSQRKKKKRSPLDLSDKYPNLPTQERMARGGVSIRNNIGKVDDPLRIDKLLNNGIIDEMQHLYGMQIITLWTIANRPFLKAVHYENTSGGTHPDFEYINISRMTAEDQYYKAMSFLNARDQGLIAKICFEELGAIEAGRSLGLPVNSITVYLRGAFDALGNALAQMRDLRKAMQKAAEEKASQEG